jgi:hypothetical protein
MGCSKALVIGSEDGRQLIMDFIFPTSVDFAHWGQIRPTRHWSVDPYVEKQDSAAEKRLPFGL